MSQSYQNKRTSKLDDKNVIRKKLALAHDSNKQIINTKSKTSGISLYSTANSQLCTSGKVTKVDISTIKRGCSIPYIHRKFEDGDQNPEKIVNSKLQTFQLRNSNSSFGCRSHHKIAQTFDQDFVLSPTKMSRIKGNFKKQSGKKCPTSQNSTKEKIVILSSSNCKNIQLHSTNVRENNAVGNFNEKKDQQSQTKIKFKIKQKNMTTLNIQKGITKYNTQLPVKSERLHELGAHNYEKLRRISKKQRQKSEGTNNRPETPMNEQQLIKKIKNNQKQINMKQMIETDKQMLKLFPKVDLTALIFKIKVEEYIRKENSIKKWSHFDYQNLSAYQL